MGKKIFILIVLFCLIFSLYTIVFSQGDFKKADMVFKNISLKGDKGSIDLKEEAFYYNNKIYAPISKVINVMGGQGFWNEEKTEIIIKPYSDFIEYESNKGEVFAYGLIMSIDYENREIGIEQYLDETTKKIPSKLKIREDAAIVLERNDKKMNIDFADLRAGEDIGLILDKNKNVRAIILVK